jgi:hypothetical protein
MNLKKKMFYIYFFIAIWFLKYAHKQTLCKKQELDLRVNLQMQLLEADLSTKFKDV